jgi:hypothetical protein
MTLPGIAEFLSSAFAASPSRQEKNRANAGWDGIRAVCLVRAEVAP